MDLVILKNGQMTRATPELAPPLLTTTPTRGHFSSIDLTCIAALHGGSFLWHWARTRDMPTMVRYLDHLIPRPQDRRQKPSRS
ncbi:hypothetical protein TNCV_314481 [Trichonephila clavipes]|nr:hypothetical protein TNCV_314481 [Trichonephila clavipes]